jgi:hypothetical protein
MGNARCRKGENPPNKWIFKHSYIDASIPPGRLTLEGYIGAMISS